MLPKYTKRSTSTSAYMTPLTQIPGRQGVSPGSGTRPVPPVSAHAMFVARTVPVRSPSVWIISSVPSDEGVEYVHASGSAATCALLITSKSKSLSRTVNSPTAFGYPARMRRMVFPAVIWSLAPEDRPIGPVV